MVLYAATMTTTTAIAFPGFALSREATTDQLCAWTEKWLEYRSFAVNTEKAFRRDVHGYFAWGERTGVAPLAANFLHVNTYRSYLEQCVDPRTGKVFADTTVDRKLTAISSWYTFLVKVGVLTLNPVGAADRPKINRDYSSTEGLTAAEGDRLLAGAAKHSKRAHAITAILLDLGIRVAELVGLELANLAYANGVYTVEFKGKGGVKHYRELDIDPSDALSAYLTERALAAGCRVDELTGFVFATASGKAIDRNYITDILRSCAKKAKLACADQITPHWLRHTYVTNSIDEGVPRHIVQHSLRHSTGRVTDRYYNKRELHKNDPSKVLGAARRRRIALEAATVRSAA